MRKTQYSISTKTIKKCLHLLKGEIELFPNVEMFMLMGDVAIKAMNYIWKEETGKRVIPNESIYKIRDQEYYINGKRVFPSYLMTGKNYLIENSKRIMIAEDIKAVIDIINRK